MDNVVDYLKSQTAFTRFLDIYSKSTRRFIVFCGAGASREAGLPDWNGLAALLREEMTQPVYSDAKDEEWLQTFDAENVLWRKFSIAKTFLGENFYNIIESALNVEVVSTTFFSRVWDLRVSGLVTMNLDGLSQKGYVKNTKKSPNAYTGREAFSAKDAFLDIENPTIIELHGNVKKRDSWILTQEDIESVSSDDAYKQFLRGIFAQSLVLTYGLSVTDDSVKGQLDYLSSIKSANGEYFMLKRSPPTESDRNLLASLAIQPIYIPESISWENGFEQFTSYVSRYRKDDPRPSIVFSDRASDRDIQGSYELLSLPPDEVRVKLNSASKKFVDDEMGFNAFKENYDLAINHAARVKMGTDNGEWLGYKLVSELGSGNFGRVFQAAAGTEGEYVAIKIAHEAVRDNAVMLNAFRRGVASMRYLSDSNIDGVVKLIDASELPPSIIMEHVSGINFDDIISHGHISNVTDIIRVIIRISEIVFSCHTHEMGVLHRDLRPQNIMVGGEYWEEVKNSDIRVLDFDLSWFEGATGQDYYMPATSALGYLAPEQIDGGSKFSARSALVDVYGLTMLLYYSLSKQHPSAAASTREDWVTRVQEAASRAYTHNWKCVPARMAKLIIEGTSVGQDRRPNLPSFIDVLKEMHEMSIGTYINKPEIILHEIYSRIFGMQPQQESYSIVNYSGVKMLSSVNYSHNRFEIIIDAMATESTRRGKLGKYLSSGMAKAKDIISKIGKIDDRESNIGLSRMKLCFSIPVPKNFHDLEDSARVLEQAISAMRIE